MLILPWHTDHTDNLVLFFLVTDSLSRSVVVVAVVAVVVVVVVVVFIRKHRHGK